MGFPTKYSDAWWDQVYETKELVEKRVTRLVDELTSGLSPDQDSQVRMLLTENYRFWRN